jgi:streptogramin lyase
MNYPISTAVDPNGTVWVVDYGNSHLTLLNASGVPLSGTTGYSSGLFAFPVAVVVDGNHFGWVANQAGTTVTKVAADGTSFTNYNCCNGASGLAIDAGNNVWVANYYGNSVSLISSAGTVVSNGAYTGGGGIDHPQGIAIDGAGNAWVANFRAPYLTELSGTNAGLSSAGAALTPATGYGTDAGLLEAYAIAADASGSLWVSNFGSNTVTKFLGLATPVKTPLSGVAQIP